VVSMLVSLIVFIVMLSVLVFVHELGHFAVAKWAGIYVDRFSIGFGKRLFGKRLGETDYCVSALPLGGYVRMAGQSDMPREQTEDGDEKLDEWELKVPVERRFTSKPPLVRASVLFAGPFMNAVFGIAVYPLVLMLGQQVPASVMDTRVGQPLEGKPAHVAGVKLGDRIVRVAGKEVDTWEDLLMAIVPQADREIELVIERPGEPDLVRLDVTPTKYDKDQLAGIGVPPFEPARLGGVVEGWPAWQAGIEPGDIVTHVNGELVDWSRFVQLLREMAGEPVELTVQRPDETEFTAVLVPRAAGMLEQVVLDQDGTVAAVEGSATGLTGLFQRVGEAFGSSADSSVPAEWKRGDRIVAVDGVPVTDREDIEELVSEVPGADVTFTVLRSNWFRREKIDIVETLGSRGKIGVAWEQQTTMLKYPPGEAIAQGVVKSIKSVDLVVRTVRWLIGGQVNVSNLAGPVGIYRIASAAWAAGFVTLLQFAAILSFNFSVLNLLPIPVLDGGQLVLVGTEAVMRRPVGIRMQIWLQRVGVALLALLMVVVFYNDIIKIIEGVF